MTWQAKYEVELIASEHAVNGHTKFIPDELCGKSHKIEGVPTSNEKAIVYVPPGFVKDTLS